MLTPTVALVYDFDLTLSPKNMQEYGFIPGIGMTDTDFWREARHISEQNGMDGILAYMYLMVEKARGHMKLSRERLRALGQDITFFPGVTDWFDRIDAIAAREDVCVEHYIVSSGLKEIIEGSAIGDRFRAVFGASFLYDAEGNAVWPATAVNYTEKTQYLYRINKGILNVSNNKDLNAYTPEYMRPVPFSRMIYFGDGYTDVPSMKTVRKKGGYAIAVYHDDDSAVADDLLLQDRADYALPADYSEGSALEQTVTMLLHGIRAQYDLNAVHKMQVRHASKRRGGPLSDSLPVRQEHEALQED